MSKADESPTRTRRALVIPGRPWNANDREDRFNRARRTKEVKGLTVGCVLEQWGGIRDIAGPILDPSDIRVLWPQVERIGRLSDVAASFTFPLTVHVRHLYRKGHDRDTVNCFLSVKAAIDSMSQETAKNPYGLGVWPDDKPKYIGPHVYYPPAKPTPHQYELLAARGRKYLSYDEWLVLVFESAR